MTKPYIIGISGGSGSGKTTLLNELKAAFSDEEICFLSQDNYYRPREEQVDDHNQVTNFDLPTSFDRSAYVSDIEKLISGVEVIKEEYTFNNEEKVAKTLVYRPCPIIILEGIFVFHFKEIASLMDFKIFVEASDTLKLIRRIKRDREERNYPIDDVLYRFEHHVMPSYNKYILPYKVRCDIIINNNKRYSESLLLVKSFLKEKLTSVNHLA